ncbi:MAG: YfcC family protein, partial [Chloroflexota bacterium]|nr:YfcC family protein [Chloroflexota bacterium]
MTDQDPASRPDAENSAEPPKKKGGFSFPTALTVLTLILGVVWAAAFVIPSGYYDRTAEGDPIPGSYTEIPKCQSGVELDSTPIRSIDRTPDGEPCIDKSALNMFQMLWIAPPNGLYGIEDEFGTVNSGNTGNLYGSAEIFFFVLVVGAFITVTMRTGAVTAGISRLALRFKNSPRWLIVILMVVFALGGTAYGMWEETLGFYTLLVALTLAMRFDRMVGAGIIFIGAGTGIVASTVNPFATGVASDAAGIAISDGLLLRVLMWLVLVPVGILYVLWYAKRVEKDPTKSVVGLDPHDTADEVEDVPKLDGRQKTILAIFLGTFVVMVYGF